MNRLETNPVNLQDGVILNGWLNAQMMAAQRDIAIAETRIDPQTTSNSSKGWLSDVHYVETMNSGINLYNDRALPVFRR